MMAPDKIDQEFENASFYEEWETDPIWQKFLKQQSKFNRDRTHTVNEMMLTVPDGTRKEFLRRLQKANSQQHAVDFERHALGVAFSMQRLATMMARRKEEMKLSGDRLVINEGRYTTYSDEDTPPQEKPITIEDHFTLYRNGQPFIYKAKYSPTRQFGEVDKDQKDPHFDYNQMLKYNQAIEEGMISGAAIEIRGIIDPDFLNWACGTSVLERGEIPHVQMIYNMELPSGQEFRFTLKKPESYIEELELNNDQSRYTKEDLAVVEGIENALRSHDQVQLIEIISGQTVFANKGELSSLFCSASSPVRESEMKDPEFYDGYLRMMSVGIWERAKRIKPETYNPDRDTVFSPENIGIEDDLASIKERIVKFVEHSRQNPQSAVSVNIFKGDLDSAQNQALLMDVAIEASKNVGIIREQENLRRAAEKQNPLLESTRKKKKWEGPDDGYKLSLNAVILDSIANVKSFNNAQAPARSYDHPPERFMNIDELLDMLDERQDASRKVLSFYDPLTTEGAKRKVIENITDNNAAGRKAKVIRENNKRITAVIDGSDPTGLKLNRNERRRYNKRKTAIKSVQSEIAQVLRDKMAHPQKMKAKAEELGLKKLPKDHPMMADMQKFADRTNELHEELSDLMCGILDTNKENSLTQKIHVHEKNILKIIYTVDHKGQMVFEEEKTNVSEGARRASHSELTGGKNVYGAGEIIFSKPAGKKQWELVEVNNGSGHYRPPPQTLRYVANCMIETLEGAYRRRGLHGAKMHDAVRKMLTKARMTDALARGINLPKEELDIKKRLNASLVKTGHKPLSGPSMRGQIPAG